MITTIKSEGLTVLRYRGHRFDRNGVPVRAFEPEISRGDSVVIDDREFIAVDGGEHGFALVEMLRPQSTNVLAYGYEPVSGTIVVRFLDRSLYIYVRRAATVWRDFRAAGSKGTFVKNCLTPAGNYERIRS